uniref:Uncharacterized protein n=1 Tax=Psilocybe cubensis TaxID=181762 RepID=A0A8H7Y7M9_PSICU
MDLSSRLAANTKLVHVVRACSYSTFFLGFWDWVTTLNFETRVIWRRTTDKSIRRAYCTSRYVGLVALAINMSVVSFLQFSHFDSQYQCRIWYGYQLATSTILLYAMNYNLIYRLRALYKGSPLMNRILITGSTIEAMAVISFGGWSIATLSFSNDGGCLPMHAPPQVLYLTVSQMASQIAICALTSFKSFRLYFQSGWTDMPLLSLVTRDGFAVFLLFMGLLGAMLSDATNREPGSHTAQLCYFIFPLYVTLLSLSSCRIIINIKTFTSDKCPRLPSNCGSDNIVLSTVCTANPSFS